MPGDWNGFFGLFTNVALNVIVLTGLCLGVVKMPDEHRLRPGAAGARHRAADRQSLLRLAGLPAGEEEGRSDVTALPYGPSVPHMFIVVFLVMLPTYLKTKDPILAWQAGLAWAFIIGVVILLGAFIGPTLAQIYPARGDARGARRHLDRLHLDAPGVSVAGRCRGSPSCRWRSSWSAGAPACGCPAACRAASPRWWSGPRIGWVVTLTGISPVMDPHAVGAALAKFGVHVPIPSLDFIAGLHDIGPLLVIAVPLGIYNFTEGMNNVESAAAAGDEYNLRKVLIADGIGALAGALLGSPFPPAVYIGHPGWKAVGGRIGYSLATGIVISLVCFTGLDGVAAGGGAARRDPADPALYRPGDRRPGVRDRRRPGMLRR